VYSILAFFEARQAKRAATEAGKTVKIQTVTLEFSDIRPKLDRLKLEINFDEAHDLLNEVNWRLRRLTSPFEKDAQLAPKIIALREALDKAQGSLNNVRPTDLSKEEVPHTVYYAMVGDFAAINNSLADLLGLFEKKTINFGEDDANATGSR
jgi:hypothetical protein